MKTIEKKFFFLHLELKCYFFFGGMFLIANQSRMVVMMMEFSRVILLLSFLGIKVISIKENCFFLIPIE